MGIGYNNLCIVSSQHGPVPDAILRSSLCFQLDVGLIARNVAVIVMPSLDTPALGGIVVDVCGWQGCYTFSRSLPW